MTTEKTTKRITKTPKRTQLRALLGHKTPLSVDALSKKLGWQCHTTRAAISRLRSDGVEIETIQGPVGKPARYRLRPEASASDASTEVSDQ